MSNTFRHALWECEWPNLKRNKWEKKSPKLWISWYRRPPKKNRPTWDNDWFGFFFQAFGFATVARTLNDSSKKHIKLHSVCHNWSNKISTSSFPFSHMLFYDEDFHCDLKRFKEINKRIQSFNYERRGHLSEENYSKQTNRIFFCSRINKMFFRALFVRREHMSAAVPSTETSEPQLKTKLNINSNQRESKRSSFVSAFWNCFRASSVNTPYPVKSDNRPRYYSELHRDIPIVELRHESNLCITRNDRKFSSPIQKMLHTKKSKMERDNKNEKMLKNIDPTLINQEVGLRKSTNMQRKVIEVLSSYGKMEKCGKEPK